MNPWSSLNNSIELPEWIADLARQRWETGSDRARLSAEIARRVADPIVGAELDGAQAELLALARRQLDCRPQDARSAAHVAFALAEARADEQALANAALTLATVSNRLGEFRAAVTLAEQADAWFCRLGANDARAFSVCEAAWAATFAGDLDRAGVCVEQARVLSDSVLLRARCDWIQANILRDRAQYAPALELYNRSRAAYQDLQLPLQAARCELDTARGLYASGSAEAASLLEHARAVLDVAGCALDVARCDLARANAASESPQSPDALDRVAAMRQAFVALGADFFAADCDMALGNMFNFLNRHTEARQAYGRARDYFLGHGIAGRVSGCDMNLGTVYFRENRYDDALALYEEALSYSARAGRGLRTARLQINIALVYLKQGRLSQSLDLYYRTLQFATEQGLDVLATACHHGLAICYRLLGQYDQALEYLHRRREAFIRRELDQVLFLCDLEEADLHLARGDIAQTTVCVERARAYAVAQGFDAHIAICDRLLAQTAADKKAALPRIRNARRLFLEHNQTIDGALCDMTEGELRLRWNEPRAAQAYFRRAQVILSPAFPEQSWRTEYGLARCAAAQDRRARALEHYLRAVRTIAAARSALVTEQLSNDFFAHRQSIYDAALALARELDADGAALEIVEASKARMFLTHLQRRGWKLRSEQHDPYVAGLAARERELHYEINALRAEIAVEAPGDMGDPLRDGLGVSAVGSAKLEELNALSQAYESVVTQLRLATPGLAGVAAPPPFELEHFRRAAQATFGDDWVALDYYLTGDALTTLVIGPNDLRVSGRELSSFNRRVLQDCTASERDLRELIYRGTVHGRSASGPGLRYLQHLYRLLIPPDLKATTLIVAPHGQLHALPFHALWDGSNFLAEQCAVVYTPSLQVMQRLLGPAKPGPISNPLILGVGAFGNRARPLDHISAEVEQVHRMFGHRGRALFAEQATRQGLLDLEASGALERFDLLHLATHAVIDRQAPHQSGVLLHDDTLTALDVLDLTLDARLVTLSACETAMGKGGQGDELVGLARAFFFAGAERVLAALWAVDDNSMLDLTGRFYGHWIEGQSVAKALQNAQLDLIHAGAPPYAWAPLVLIGRP